MRRVVAATFLLVTLGCSSKGDTPQGEGGAGGATSSGGSPAATGGTGGSGGQIAAADGAIGAGGQSGSTGGATGSGGKLGATGGATGTGGQPVGAGGTSAGGTTGSGGKPGGAGGAPASGGKPGGTGGATGSGGKPGGTGGATGSGGRLAATGGTPGMDAGTSAHTNPLSQALIDEFVTAHNNARSGSIVALNPPPSPPLPTVSWDPILADSAYNYLVKCQSTDGQLVDHNANRSSDYVALGGTGYVGENIYAMSGGAAKPTDAVTLWMGEASSYDYASNSGNAGHYTQVVWRTSIRIGCAIVNCPSVKYSSSILCDYSPGGNMSGQKPY